MVASPRACALPRADLAAPMSADAPELMQPIRESDGRRKRQRDEGSPAQLDDCHTISPTSDMGSCEEILQLPVDIGCLFDDDTLSDVTITVHHDGVDHRWRCHKVILASMSTYFRSLFTGGMQEARQGEVALHGVDPDCCEHVLRLLYGQALHITPDNVLTFMHLADYYGVPQLLARTKSLLASHVTFSSGNCCAKLVEATALRCMHAQTHCMRVLLRDFASAIRRPPPHAPHAPLPPYPPSSLPRARRRRLAHAGNPPLGSWTTR